MCCDLRRCMSWKACPAKMNFYLLHFILVLGLAYGSLPCFPVDFGHGSVVCQCNVTYCDTIDQLSHIEFGQFYQVTSDKAGARFVTKFGEIKKHRSPLLSSDESVVKIRVNREIQYQNIIGFGGAFTDAAGINIFSLPESLQETILKQYYDGSVGLNYSFARVPMGGTDFSTHTYSYDDADSDPTLANFHLQPEDLQLKIPFLTKAKSLQPSLKLFASPWSAPKWMKTNNEFYGKGSLKLQYYQVWANYFVKFLKRYTQHNLTFWAVTAQNEPNDGNLEGFSFNCMGWSAEAQRDWIKNHLGPTLNHSFPFVKIIMLDDQRIHVTRWTRTILSDPEAAKFINGVGLHWYVDALVSPSVLDRTHEEFPNHFLLATEACIGSLPLERHVILGSWERAEMYASDIITDLNHWVVGWVDWNIALSMTGGPSWAHNEVDAPIIVDSGKGVIYKQPLFYALGHFSKFIAPDSVRIQSGSDDFKGLTVLACLRPDLRVVVVILNILNREIKVQLDSHQGYIELEVGPNSINTLVYL